MRELASETRLLLILRELFFEVANGEIRQLPFVDLAPVLCYLLIETGLGRFRTWGHVRTMTQLCPKYLETVELRLLHVAL